MTSITEVIVLLQKKAAMSQNSPVVDKRTGDEPNPQYEHDKVLHELYKLKVSGPVAWKKDLDRGAAVANRTLATLGMKTGQTLKK